VNKNVVNINVNFVGYLNIFWDLINEMKMEVIKIWVSVFWIQIISKNFQLVRHTLMS
jgi:hypothetical protein